MKFGALLESLFARPGGPELRTRILDMPNPEYQRLLRCTADELRVRLPGEGAGGAAIAALIGELDDDTLIRAIRNLGGHDLDALRAAYAQIDDTRPTVIIAYTIKGHGLPTQGHPQNHSSLLTVEQFAQLASELGMDPANPWPRFDPETAAGRMCADDRCPAGQEHGGYRHSARGSRRHRPHPIRHLHHPSRPRAGVTGPDPRGARRGQTRGHREPRRELHHQPGRMAQQGGRVVAQRAPQLVRRRSRDDHALAGEAHRAAHGTRYRRNQPGRVDR